jgi:UPF0755 protein
MSSHRPAEPPHYNNRATGALARSPSEQLEPTRPLARSRSRRRIYSRGYGREPGRSWGLFRIVSGIFTLLLLLMAIFGALALVLQNWVNAPGPLTASKSVVVPKGAGVHDVAARLEREGVISDRRLFIAGYLMAKVTGRGEGARALQLRAGDYEIPQAASIRKVIDIITEGRTIAHRVTIPEGLTSDQIVERLKADPNLTGEVTEVPPEGSLLPETFIVRRGATRQSILDSMRAESKKLMEKLWAQRQKDLPLKSWDEAVVLASMVEKEAGRNDERERVAAVFLNRLRQNMRLQSDPTILYGLNPGKTVWNRPIMKSEIAQKTSHNTYQIDGLPPTPICNPGRASIEAVLNPASTKDLYFVADGSGGHMFSETLKDHNSNVQKWRALEREKEAKAKMAGPGAGTTQGPTTGPPPGTAVSHPEKAPEKSAEKAGAGKMALGKSEPDKTVPHRVAPDKTAADKKAHGKAAPDKAASGKAAPNKAAADKAKGATAPSAKPGAAHDDGAWASTTEPATVRPKR